MTILVGDGSLVSGSHAIGFHHAQKVPIGIVGLAVVVEGRSVRSTASRNLRCGSKAGIPVRDQGSIFLVRNIINLPVLSVEIQCGSALLNIKNPVRI